MHPLRTHLYSIGRAAVQLSVQGAYVQPFPTAHQPPSPTPSTTYGHDTGRIRSDTYLDQCRLGATHTAQAEGKASPPSLPGLRPPSKSKYTLEVPSTPAVHIPWRLVLDDARHGSKAREGRHGSVAQRHVDPESMTMTPQDIAQTVVC